MDLYIAEKPSLARTLAEYLAKDEKTVTKKGYIIGNGWIMTWCFGHLYELADPSQYSDKWAGAWNLDSLPIIPLEYKYLPKEKTKDQLKIIHDLCANCSRIISAPDGDREGTYLVDLVIQHSTYKGPVFRLWLSDLSTPGLEKSFSSIKPNSEYRSLFNSAQCRSQADWLVGINFSRLYTCLAQNKGYRKILSLGRVQTVAFSIIHNRCKEIEEFKSLSHYGLEVSITSESGKYSGQWLIPKNITNENDYLINREKCEAAQKTIKAAQGIIKDIQIQDKKQHAPLPFSLSQLQIYSSQKWGYSAKQVLNTCQYLYEDLKLLSYPRTDCSYLSEGDLRNAESICDVILSNCNNLPDKNKLDLKSKPRCYNDKKITAHTAIIPTLSQPNFDKYLNLSEKERKSKKIGQMDVIENIYDAVAKRFISQFLPEHKYQTTTVVTECKGLEFKSTGKIIIHNGWKDILNDQDTENENTRIIPSIKKGDQISISDCRILDKKTRPPEYFTEGTLIKVMSNIENYVDERIREKFQETDGIGTEATRADIIERIKFIGYIISVDKKLMITEMGREIYPWIPPYFKTPAMTAIWEKTLEGIAVRNFDPNIFKKNITSWTETQIKILLKNPPNIKLTVDDKYKCENCKSPVFRKIGKYGPYWPCSNRECKTSYTDYKMAPLYPLEGDGKLCPECIKNERNGIMKTRIFKEDNDKGRPAKVFLGCNKFPKCKYKEM